MNQLHVGTEKNFTLPDNFLLIDDGETPLSLPKRKKVTRFDVTQHHFNPLKGIDYLKARNISSVLYEIQDQGENTLTVRNGRRALARILLNGKRLDKLRFTSSDADQEAKGMIDDVLFSPVVKTVLCGNKNFSFKGVLLARFNRAELGEDAKLLANLLIDSYDGVVVIPDFGFYGTKHLVQLIRQNRLIAGVNYLNETPLKRDLLLIKDKFGQHCLHEDAETLASYKGLIPSTNEYNDFVKDCM